MLRRRYLTLALIASLFVLGIFLFYSDSWRAIPVAVGPDGKIGAGLDHDGNLKSSTDHSGSLEDPNAWKDGRQGGRFKEPKVDVTSPYPIGTMKPPGSNYTRVLVMPKLRAENTRWIEEELSDMIDAGILQTAIYTMNDPTAPLHPIRNKGHEVMAYLSYIIDRYEDLPDVSIFMHAHQYSWHNNIILDEDAALMIRHFSPERATREGYMNLRCHWDPGCPDWLHPGETNLNTDKKEEFVLADAWAEIFPREPIPTVLAQPCCAQFAVSRERINAIPKSRFVWLRDWILRTDLDDFLSGRVFEYTWQYIFSSSPIHCPSMSACYCDGYGLCFGSPENFDYYFELRHNSNEQREQLDEWNEKAEMVEYARRHAKGGRLNGEENLEVPEFGRDVELKTEMNKLRNQLEIMVNEAFERGKDPKQRAKEAGREWKEGDGF